LATGRSLAVGSPDDGVVVGVEVACPEALIGEFAALRSKPYVRVRGSPFSDQSTG
jgi:hypothetical protein